MLVKALGAFAVLIAGVGSAHAQELSSAPAQPLDFTVAPAADQTYTPLSQAAQAPDPFSPSVWRTGELTLSAPNSISQQRLQMSVGERYLSPDGLPIARPEEGLAGAAGRVFDVNYSLGLPGALSFSTPGHDWDLTPHAGFGVSTRGTKASAGAVLSIRDRANSVLEGLGVRDGASMSARGRYYLFAAASGKAVGLNLLRNSDGDWRRAGWTTDPANSLIGETQVGVGWRRGPVQTSVGYVHRDYEATRNSLRGLDGKDDDMVAFSLSVRPH